MPRDWNPNLNFRLSNPLRNVRRRLRLDDLSTVWAASRLVLFRRQPAVRSPLPAQRQAERHQSYPRVLFLLPVGPGGGGVHSVVQEAAGMCSLGTEARVAIPASLRDAYRRHYPAREDELFVTFDGVEDLVSLAARFHVAIGTLFRSMWLVRAIVALHPHVVPAYYVQDYEPLFFSRFSLSRWLARRSYGLVPGTLRFAKTRWLCDRVWREHGLRVEQVVPSLDRDVYFPAEKERDGRPPRVTAMIRPMSPQRGAARTMRVLRRLSREAPALELHLFGCSDQELASYRLETGFPFVNHGPLIRDDVAALLRRTDVFVDFSDYQAFGRTALEAMACGCAVVVPAEGGAAEYAVDGRNSLVADTHADENCLAALTRLVRDASLRRRLQAAAVATSQRYSIESAAISELALFRERCDRQLILSEHTNDAALSGT